MVKVMLKKEQKFLADWYETYKYEFEYYVYKLLSDYGMLSSKEFTEKYGSQMLYWVDHSDNEPIRTLVKMDLFGYEFYE